MANWDPSTGAGGMGGAGGGDPWGGLFPAPWGHFIDRTFGSLTGQVSTGAEHAIKHVAHDIASGVHDVAHGLSHGVGHGGNLPVVAVPIHGGGAAGTTAGSHAMATHVVGGAAISHAASGLAAAHVGAAHALAAVAGGSIGVAVAALGGLAVLSQLPAEEEGRAQPE